MPVVFVIDHFITGTKFNIESVCFHGLIGGERITSTKLHTFESWRCMFVVRPEDCMPYVTEGEDTLCSGSSLTRPISYGRIYQQNTYGIGSMWIEIILLYPNLLELFVPAAP